MFRGAVQRFRFILGQVIFQAMVCAVVCLALPASTAADSHDRITAAVLADFPPLYVTDNNGQPDGFALDVFQEVAAAAGISFDILVVKNWAEAMEAVRTNKADVIPGIGISPARKSEFLFSSVFETIAVSCFVRADTFNIKGVYDLIGHRTAVINKSAAQTKLAVILGMHLVRFDSVDEALFSLLTGKVDAFVFPEPVLWRKVRNTGLDDQIKVVGKPLMELRRGYLFRKSDTALKERLNTELAAYVVSPGFAERYMKWQGAQKPFWTIYRVLTACGIGAFLIAVMLVAWRYKSITSLNRQLQQTMEARLEVEERLRASEQRLNRSQEIASFGSFERNLVTGKGYWSDGLFKLFRLDPGHEAPMFHEFMDILHPDDRIIYMRANDAMTQENPHQTFEFRFLPKGETDYRHARCSQTHEFDENGASVRRIGAIQDITERKNIAAALLRAKERAEAANRSKSEFLANMSHELRTPLNGALGMLQLLSMDDLHPQHREYVDTAISSCRNLTDLLGDILDLSRVEAGKMDLVVKQFRPADILNSVRDTFSKVAADKRVNFNFKLSPELPDWLEGDPARLRQVLFNLVGNALKFTESGSVTVEASPIGNCKPESCRVLFSVIDTGIGIPETMLDKVFGAFTQVDGAYSRKFGGAGLGLHIVKRLAELMNGQLSIESDVGAGTTVHFSAMFSLPKTGEETPDQGLLLPGIVQAGRRILIAEDDRINQIAIGKFVEKLGHKPDLVSNGEEALSKLAKGDYDVILMDIQMPVMNGVEATRRIRAAEYLGAKKHIPIIALTAHAMSGDRERFLKKGMTDYLSKPVDISELEQVLTRIFA